jgi:hypothetical protein
MSGPHNEKDFKELDPVGVGANTTAHDEPVASPRGQSPPDSISSSDDADKYYDNEKHPGKVAQGTEEALSRKQTNATGITDMTDVTEAPEMKKRTWSQRLNPLKRNPPPVPKERGISREYTAGLFSLLTWTWVTPLMSVC